MLQIYSLIQNEESFILPNIQFNKTYSFTNENTQQTIYFSKSELQSFEKGKLVIGFKNSAVSTNNIRVQLNFDGIKSQNFSSAKNLKIIIGVSVAAFAAIIRILFALCNKNKFFLFIFIREKKENGLFQLKAF